MRVMQFLTVFESGGTERQGLNLGLSLSDRGQAVQFGCLRRSGRLLAEVEARGIPVREYPLCSFYSARLAAEALRLGRDLRRDRVDVVHAYNFYGNVFAAPTARLAGVPLVVAGVRDMGVYLDARKRRAQRRACRLADLILVNAASIRDWLVSDGFRPDKIVVIPNGVDMDRFERPAKEGASVRRELGVPPDAPLLSTIARLCPSKGFEDAIDAMAVIHAARPDARLLVVGEALVSRNGQLQQDDAYRQRLEGRARDLGIAHRVHFLGYRDDVPALLREVWVSMQPSLTEGLSNSVLEAMAAGRAVVATPVGGTPEVMTHGQSGWLTPVSDPRRLGEAALALLADEPLRRRLGDAARRVIRDRLSVPAMVEATERLYARELERRRGTRRGAGRTESPVAVP